MSTTACYTSAWIRGLWASHEGRIREHNEDACLFRVDRDVALAVVADGMGASSSGRPAADLTIATCASAFDQRIQDYAEAWWLAEHDPGVIAWSALAPADRASVEAHVRNVCTVRAPATPGDIAILEQPGEVLAAIAHRGLVEASRAVWARSSSDPLWRGMGATGVAAVFAHGAAGVAHVGDARMYRLRGGALEQLTTDHTLLAEWIATQSPTPEEIEAFPHKYVITRAIGFPENTVVDARVVDTQPGDVFLLCTDGIWRTLDVAHLLHTLEQCGCDAARDLVDAARHSERNVDNVTAVVVEIVRSAT